MFKMSQKTQINKQLTITNKQHVILDKNIIKFKIYKNIIVTYSAKNKFYIYKNIHNPEEIGSFIGIVGGGNNYFTVYKDIIISCVELSVLIYNYETKECICRIYLDGFVTGDPLVFNDKLYITSGDNVSVYELYTWKKETDLIGHTDRVCVIIGYENYLITGSWDDTIKIWDLSTNKFINTCVGHKFIITQIIIKDKFIISSSADSKIKIWDINTARCLNTLEKHELSINNIIMTDDNKYILSCGDDRKICIWDVSSANPSKYSFIQNIKFNRPINDIYTHDNLIIYIEDSKNILFGLAITQYPDEIEVYKNSMDKYYLLWHLEKEIFSYFKN